MCQLWESSLKTSPGSFNSIRLMYGISTGTGFFNFPLITISHVFVMLIQVHALISRKCHCISHKCNQYQEFPVLAST